MKSPRYLNMILTVLTVVMALNLLTQWASGPSWSSSAVAAEPRAKTLAENVDEFQQSKAIVDELKKLNKRADEVADLLRSGRMFVKVAGGAKEE